MGKEDGQTVNEPGTRLEKRWILRSADPRRVQALLESTQAHPAPLSPVMARLLVCRGIDTPEKVATFLSPLLRTGLRSPLLFPDMRRATDRVLHARERGEPVCIWGDYDVDGVTGSSQLILFLREIGMDPRLYIPHRTREGYGLNTPAIEKLAGEGTKVLITADCGATGHKEIARAQQLGIDVIVCDHHHVPEEKLPAYAVLNPMEADCPFSFSGLSGAGVAFYLLMGLRMRLREQGQHPVPDLRLYLDLVCLGTVADLVPLVEENRVLVTHGLRQIENSQRPGIRALRAVSGDSDVTASYIGFRLGPRINAGGRLAEAQKAVELLTTTDTDRARLLAAELDKENLDRRTIEEEILKQAVALAQAQLEQSERYSFVLASAQWHPGVIGIVASRLVERFGRPTILIAIDGDMGKGSGRSPAVFHLYEGMRMCAEHLAGYGGHRQAAGLSIRAASIQTFADQFEAVARQRLTPDDLVPIVEFDADVDVALVGPELLDDLHRLEPCGQGNPAPVFRASHTEVVSVRVVGDRSHGKAGHLKLVVRSSQGGRPVDAIGFGIGDRPIVPRQHVDLLYTPTINVWNGQASLQLRVRDLKEH